MTKLGLFVSQNSCYFLKHGLQTCWIKNLLIFLKNLKCRFLLSLSPPHRFSQSRSGSRLRNHLHEPQTGFFCTQSQRTTTSQPTFHLDLLAWETTCFDPSLPGRSPLSIHVALHNHTSSFAKQAVQGRSILFFLFFFCRYDQGGKKKPMAVYCSSVEHHPKRGGIDPAPKSVIKKWNWCFLSLYGEVLFIPLVHSPLLRVSLLVSLLLAGCREQDSHHWKLFSCSADLRVVRLILPAFVFTSSLWVDFTGIHVARKRFLNIKCQAVW